jgi:mannose-6-phosphate isomerase-like protein (cupin superfamily)
MRVRFPRPPFFEIDVLTTKTAVFCGNFAELNRTTQARWRSTKTGYVLYFFYTLWRPSDGGDDGVVHLRLAAGTEDLPLHVHEYSDRLLVVTSGIGLFHYLPDADKARELRSLVVEAGDVVIFTRGLIHTFTAPLGDLTLLSYHAPFFEFDDTRQFTIVSALRDRDWCWRPRCIIVKTQRRDTGEYRAGMFIQ